MRRGSQSRKQITRLYVTDAMMWGAGALDASRGDAVNPRESKELLGNTMSGERRSLAECGNALSESDREPEGDISSDSADPKAYKEVCVTKAGG